MRSFALIFTAAISFGSPGSAQECKEQCVQVLRQSGATSYEIQRQCCPLARTDASSRSLGDICVHEFGICLMIQPKFTASSCVCADKEGVALGQVVGGLGQIDQQARWALGSTDRCGEIYFRWVIGSDRMAFRSQLGDVDIEKIIEKRSDGYLTETVESTHRGPTSSAQVGTKWEYHLQTNKAYQVHRLPAGETFTLVKCEG